MLGVAAVIVTVYYLLRIGSIRNSEQIVITSRDLRFRRKRLINANLFLVMLNPFDIDVGAIRNATSSRGVFRMSRQRATCELVQVDGAWQLWLEEIRSPGNNRCTQIGSALESYDREWVATLICSWIESVNSE